MSVARLAITKLRATAAVTTITPRIYLEGDALQNTTLPRVLVKEVSGVPVGAMGGNTGTERWRVQVSCIGATSTSADALATQVVTALENWSEAATTPTIGSCHLVLKANLQQSPWDDSDTGAFTEVRDFELWAA